MRKAVALVAGLLVLAFVNYGIYGRERLVREGRVMVLRLAPVDPRSLMQGDYMRLRFEAADQAQLASGADSRADGRIVLALDATAMSLGWNSRPPNGATLDRNLLRARSLIDSIGIRPFSSRLSTTTQSTLAAIASSSLPIAATRGRGARTSHEIRIAKSFQ